MGAAAAAGLAAPPRSMIQWLHDEVAITADDHHDVHRLDEVWPVVVVTSCAHCGFAKHMHVNKACLFAPTTYKEKEVYSSELNVNKTKWNPTL